MLKIFQRMSWTTSFVLPIVLGMIVVLVGLTQPQLPRMIFIVGFVFCLIFLPGILIAGKIVSEPRKTMDVVLQRIDLHGYVTLQLPDGRTESFQAPALNREVVMGKMQEGEKLRVTTRGDIVFKYERLSHDVEYWPEQTGR